MDQRPIDGAAPLPAPSSDVARAYLEEVATVRSRREARIDRRGAGRLALVEAVVLSVYVTVIAISMGESSASSSFIVFVGLYLLWIQLATQRREGYGIMGSGVSAPWTTAIVLCVVLVVVLGAAFLAGVTGAEIPFLVRLVPGTLVLLVLGAAAIRAIRRSAPPTEIFATRRRRLSIGARWATIVVGAVMAAGIWVLSAGDDLLRSFLGMLFMLGYLTWWTVTRVVERVPALGAVWAWPQWTAFAFSGVIIMTIVLLQARGETGLLVFGPAAAAAAFILHLGCAFLDGRDG